MRKGSVFSTTTGLIFQIAPVISLVTVLCAILMIPFGKQEALIHFEGDFVFLHISCRWDVSS
ncbi:MAG: NADH-quinone oxidoreductase subunit H [Bacteroidales bacterium]|nr:NADH-quinone oxidoreductase subunit H [Bacteroidales bacterium]